jgi:hypothetical protein
LWAVPAFSPIPSFKTQSLVLRWKKSRRIIPTCHSPPSSNSLYLLARTTFRVSEALLHRSTQQRSAFLFGVVFVVALLILAILFPNPTAFQYTIFRGIFSLASAGVAAMIPGFITLVISKWLRAGGALAVFAIVYFYNPAALVSSASPRMNNIRGDQDQVINGNTGCISIKNDRGTAKETEDK